jgi:hypothetical protein
MCSSAYPILRDCEWGRIQYVLINSYRHNRSLIFKHWRINCLDISYIILEKHYSLRCEASSFTLETFLL